MIRRVFTCFLVLIILSTSILNISAINIQANFGVFSGTVSADIVEQSTSLENIKIDIYSSTLDQQDPSLGLKGYAHEYVFSIYTNEDGSFSFTKPSFEFLVIIDIDSLPDGYGIEKGTYFYKRGESTDTFLLRPISDVSVKYNPVYDNYIEVTAVTSDGTTILVPYSINTSDDRLSLKSLSSEVYTLTGTVSSSVKNIDFSFEVPFNSIACIDEAIATQKISVTDAMNLLIEKIRNAPDTTTLSQAISAAQALSNSPATSGKISKEASDAFRAVTAVTGYNGWRTAPYISNNYTTTSYPNSEGPYSVNYLAMHYQNFTLPTTGSYTIDFTVNFTNGVVGNSRCKLLLTGRSSGNIIERTMSQSSNLYTYSLTSQGSIYSKACIMPVNVGYSTSLSYRLTASLE